MNDGMIRVVYIGGSTRSGSTLLDRLLGSFEGVCSCGEINLIWNRGLKQNELCGCGVPLRSCAFWNEVFRDAYGGIQYIDLGHVNNLHRNLVRRRSILQMLFPELRNHHFSQMYKELCDLTLQLYVSIVKVSKCKILVDSSKIPAWKRTKRANLPGENTILRPVSLFTSIRGWIVSNIFCELLAFFVDQHRRMRYEDIVSNPLLQLRSLAEWLRLDKTEIENILHGSVWKARAQHTVAGNPMRFQVGEIEIRPDLGWKTSLSKRAVRYSTVVMTTSQNISLLAGILFSNSSEFV